MEGASAVKQKTKTKVRKYSAALMVNIQNPKHSLIISQLFQKVYLFLSPVLILYFYNHNVW